MPSQASVELRGAIEAQKAAIETVRAMHGPPMVRAMTRAALLVTRTARQVAKVDRGRYRASIMPEIVTSGTTVEGWVGSNLAYAPFVVLDTKPHWPPLAPILEWVRRNRLAGKYSVGTRRRIGRRATREREDLRVAWAIRRKISRVGTKGDQSLIRGITDNSERIVTLIGEGVTGALSIWGE